MAKGVVCRLGVVMLLVLLFSVGFVAAVPPVQTNTLIDSGIEIEFPSVISVKQNTDYFINAHTFNASNGLRIDNSSAVCTFHLYNQTGNHLIEEPMSWEASGTDWEYNIGGRNFSSIGHYSIIIECQADDIGGFREEGFDVTSTGQLLDDANTIIVYALLGLAIIFLALSFSFKENYWMLKSLFEFLSVLAGLIAVNSAKIIASQSDTLGTMGTSGITLIIIVVALFFLWIFVRAFKEIIKIFKEKGALRWNYD